jgi:hypothetical protein
MLQRNEIQNPMEAPEVHPAISEATDALKIEEVLRRARQIHRQHGGIFGYDFEDWAEAWRILSADSSRANFEPAAETEFGEVAGDTKEASESWLRYDN